MLLAQWESWLDEIMHRIGLSEMLQVFCKKKMLELATSKQKDPSDSDPRYMVGMFGLTRIL